MRRTAIRLEDQFTGYHLRAVPAVSAKIVPAQPVDATQVLNLSAGVSNAKVFRDRSFS